MASFSGCCLLCRVCDLVTCIDSHGQECVSRVLVKTYCLKKGTVIVCHATAATVCQFFCRGGVVAVIAVFIVDQTLPRLRSKWQQADSSNRRLTTVLESSNFPPMVLLTVGSATCAAHIALGVLEDHARIFHGEKLALSALCACHLHLHLLHMPAMKGLQGLQHGAPVATILHPHVCFCALTSFLKLQATLAADLAA